VSIISPVSSEMKSWGLLTVISAKSRLSPLERSIGSVKFKKISIPESSHLSI